MKHVLLFLLFISLSPALWAQSPANVITSDPHIDKLVEKHIYINQHESSVDGWRVQIFFDSGANSKKRATDALNRFSAQFHEVKAYLSFKEPNYRVRVGDFRTRLEAEGFMKSIQAEYPNAFATGDKINPPAISGSIPD